MKPLFTCLLFFLLGSGTYGQVKTILLDRTDHITRDSTLATGYAVYGKLSGDSLYTFKKFDNEGILLTSGTFMDDSLHVPHGKFVYYDWITPQNNNVNEGFDINGKDRYIAVEGRFEQGKKTGRWIVFYPDGKLKEIATYQQGILHGAYQLYDTGGKLQVAGLFIAGKKNGTWTSRGGKQEDEYVNDQLVSSLSGKKLREKQAKVTITN